jgi:DNA-binding transcriptional regulator YiaG
MKTKTKKRIGAQIVESLQEFLTELQNGADLSAFKCRVVEVTAPSRPADAELVKQTRAVLRASQTVFARFLGVSAQTVRAWEQGENAPSDIAKRFMDEIRHDPVYWRARLRAIVATKKPVTAS